MTPIKYIIPAVLILSATSYSATMSFQGLGDLPGGTIISQAWGISADGTTVVGRSTSANGTEAFRWTSAGGLQGLGDLPGNLFSSTAYAVNADGSVIAGTGWTLGEEAFIWTSTNGMQGLGLNSTALGLSADGGTVGGSSWFAGNQLEAMRWDATNGQDRITFADYGSRVTAVAADGMAFVGWAALSSEVAFLWTESGGIVYLGDLAGGAFFSRAHGISADGSVVVGQGQSASGIEAMRWTQAGGMVGLGDLPGGTFQSTAKDASLNGSWIVGFGRTANGLEAMMWDASNGMRNVKELLETEGGLDLTGWTLSSAEAISDDGTILAGYGLNPAGFSEAWVADLGNFSTAITLENLTAEQRPGTKLVDIYYDVSSPVTNLLGIAIAITNGVTHVGAQNLSGDIGSGVPIGTQRHIVWDAGSDWSGNVAELEFTLFAVNGPIITPATATVAKTGQTISYAPGDDGDLQTGITWPIPRFTVTGNGTAIDNLTGLEWVLEPAQMPGNSVSMLWSNAVVFCDDDTYQGGGWRLPSYKEMLSLVDFNSEGPALPSGHPFLGIDSVNYWTGSTSSWNSPTNAFAVHMSSGNGMAQNKNYSAKVWPVRGGSASSPAPVPQTGQTTSYQPHDDGALKTGTSWPSPRFVDLGNGVVRDTLTGLEWTSQPHVLAGATMDWSNAVAFCESLNHGSTQDWRLPTIKELESVTSLDSNGPANWLNSAETPFSGLFASVYWTGTTKAGSTNQAWFMSLSNPSYGLYNKTFSLFVWPVRTGAPGVALPTGVSAWSDTDSRDYSLTVSSPYGTPIPGLGTTSTFAWRSAITASVEGVVSAAGTNYTCSGWNGTGSIPVLGSGTNTGAIVLTDVSSSIDWRWIVDTDSDQIPDNWELQYFGSTTGAVATVDNDDDGYTAWQEFILGSNPTNGGSSFLFTPSPTQPTNTAFSIDFTTVTGRLYTVECTDELGSGNWVVLTNFIGNGSAVQLIDPANIPACFYQVRIDWTE